MGKIIIILILIFISSFLGNAMIIAKLETTNKLIKEIQQKE